MDVLTEHTSSGLPDVMVKLFLATSEVRPNSFSSHSQLFGSTTPNSPPRLARINHCEYLGSSEDEVGGLNKFLVLISVARLQRWEQEFF